MTLQAKGLQSCWGFGTLVSIALAPETRGRSLDELEQLANNGWRDVNGKRVFYSSFDPEK